MGCAWPGWEDHQQDRVTLVLSLISAETQNAPAENPKGKGAHAVVITSVDKVTKHHL